MIEILVLLVIVVYYLASLPARREKQKDKKEQYNLWCRKLECKKFIYVLTWMIFQDLTIEVYQEWENRGAAYPIGIYHKTFREIGKELYQSRTPAEEALVRATTYLNSIGYHCYIPGTIYEETSIYEPPRKTKPITEYDFQYRRPDRVYYESLMHIPEESNIQYRGRIIKELSEDDWRRREYLASDGTRHPLRSHYNFLEEQAVHPSQQDYYNWSSRI